MKFELASARECLKAFDFEALFLNHLGWDRLRQNLDITLAEETVRFTAIAQKRGFTVWLCPRIPDRATRLKLDHQVTRSSHEHFIIWTDRAAGQQVWQWVRREPGKPLANRDHRFSITQSGDALLQRLNQIAVSLEEEELELTVLDVAGRARSAFDVDKVTRKFYDRFKAEHAAFQKHIQGISDKGALEWYASLMLNRLMFVYFIQKKGFLDGDTNYLRTRLQRVQASRGKGEFLSFYRYFLLRLFHEGLGQSPEDRHLNPEFERLLGTVPYLNGGFFEVHHLEETNPHIDIPDVAFEKLFTFFDAYSWHLDERPLRADNEINPDVIGYIFEKYINQKQMGAYYTKEDITEYISKNTIIPYLLDAAKKGCAVAFAPEAALWRLLKDNPDRYLYGAVRHGVIDETGNIIPLPDEIAAGITDVSRRDGWNRPAPQPFALPTETWREHVARRQRCLEIRRQLAEGEVHEVNDLITLNLDLWQFARDAIGNAEGPELLRAFWTAIEKVTVLDPTCGSGAFLFAALRILETLYDDCLERMERFVEDLEGRPHHPNQYGDFKKVLSRISSHPNQPYFILKSIIINNLYGVDIMDEAVEICKLRLFLKLVSQVETALQIEPLPDIDFNIRSGNTLVGYVTEAQARRAFTHNHQGQGKLLLGDSGDAFDRFKDSMETVRQAFALFRQQQTIHGGTISTDDKHELRRRLSALSTELDAYLATEHLILDSTNSHTLELDRWRESHKPFHWFVEFYGIIDSGGFDVIIGNPPYVEYPNTSIIYILNDYETLKCRNLYAYVMERCVTSVCSANGRIGFIVPIGVICGGRMLPAQDLLLQKVSTLHLAHFSAHGCPSILFEGVFHRLTIAFLKPRDDEMGKNSSKNSIHTSAYMKWYRQERDHLFHTISFSEITIHAPIEGIPKVDGEISKTILRKLLSFPPGITKCITRQSGNIPENGDSRAYYYNAPLHWMKAMTFLPRSWNERDGSIHGSHYKHLDVGMGKYASSVVAVMNSSLFYFYFICVSNCRDLQQRDVDTFPFQMDGVSSETLEKLDKLCDDLMKSYRSKSRVKIRMQQTTGRMELEEIDPRLSRQVIDNIDSVLARHFGLDQFELDWIINFQAKYRMGNIGEG